MENHELYEQEMNNFNKRVYRAMDLLKDSAKYKCMVKYYANNEEDKQRYIEISKTLLDLFMMEHASIGEYFKEN